MIHKNSDSRLLLNETGQQTTNLRRKGRVVFDEHMEVYMLGKFDDIDIWSVYFLLVEWMKGSKSFTFVCAMKYKFAKIHSAETVLQGSLWDFAISPLVWKQVHMYYTMLNYNSNTQVPRICLCNVPKCLIIWSRYHSFARLLGIEECSVEQLHLIGIWLLFSPTSWNFNRCQKHITVIRTINVVQGLVQSHSQTKPKRLLFLLATKPLLFNEMWHSVPC